jgi:ribonuclease Z
LSFAVVAALAVTSHAQNLKVTLLGTGNPRPVMSRFGPSILVEAGKEKLLFDCGRGATQRLYQLKIPFTEVTGLFLTHLHSDHTVGIPDLWLTDTKLPGAGAEVVARDIEEGIVYNNAGVKVTAFLVDHGEIKPAFGYRVDYGGHSVTMSGDTRPSDNLIKYAQGTDVLIHEVIDPEAFAGTVTADSSEQRKKIIEHHTTPEQAGIVFSRVKPKLAVYSHIVPPDVPEVIPHTRKTYAGPLEVGEDLMSIEIGGKIEVHRPSP